MKHYTHQYLRNPLHRITVDLVGMGGTGSTVLTHLGRMHAALQGLGYPGLFVRAWDADTVTESNMGRQLFSPSDMGLNKATVLINRINRFFGTDWVSMQENYKGNHTSNILITCVDTAKARVAIGKKLKWVKQHEPTDTLYYWLDMGNLKKTGQCIIGTESKNAWRAYNKEKGLKQTIKTVVQKFPQLATIKEKDQGPSCSLAEALESQDLFINTTIAAFGCNLIWKLLREGFLTVHGCYINLETLSVNPIKI